MLVITDGKVEHRQIGVSQLNKSIVEGLLKIDKPKAKRTYRQLQAQCKELGIKASGSTACLENRLVRHAQGTLTEADYPKAKRAKKAKAKVDTFGLSYRQAQKLVSYLKANMPNGTVLECELVKNVGWDNVLQNLEALARTAAFRNLFSGNDVGTVRRRKDVTEHIGCKSQTYLEELGV